MAKALTYTEIFNRFRETRNGEYTLMTPNDPKNPILSRTVVQVMHIPCGSIIDTKFQHFINDGNGRCLKCYPIERSKTKINQHTPETLQSSLQEGYTYVEGLVNVNTHCTFKHETCGTEFLAKPKDLLRRGGGCPVCANTKSRGKYAIKEGYLESIIISGYEWLESYKNDNKKLHKIRHIRCGHEYTVRPNDFQQGYRCPECSESIAPIKSRNALRIEKYLTELGFTFYLEYIDKRCKSDLNGQLRFDFALEHLDGKFLIIEYDGHFHTGKVIHDSEFTKNAIANTNRCDKIKDQFVKDHPEKYVGIYRIKHDQPLEKTLMKILRKYYDF